MANENKKRRFNIIDFLITVIILLVVALLAYIFVFSGKAEAGNTDEVKIIYTLEVKNVRDELVDNAKNNEGATVVEGTSKYNLGKVKLIDSEKATVSSHNPEDGIYLETDYDNHQNVIVTAEATAKRDGTTGRYSINGFELSVGSLVYLRLPNFAGTSYCTQISEVE